MPVSTNSLVAKVKRFGFPLGAVAALLLSVPFIVCHQRVNAASYASPLDDNSVSSLVSLDNAVEAVAARVTPSVVNVSVTARVTGDQEGDGDQDAGNAPNAPNGIPPGLRQFFDSAVNEFGFFAHDQVTAALQDIDAFRMQPLA